MFAVNDATQQIKSILIHGSDKICVSEDAGTLTWWDTTDPAVYIITEKEVIDCLSRTYL